MINNLSIPKFLVISLAIITLILPLFGYSQYLNLFAEQLYNAWFSAGIFVLFTLSIIYFTEWYFNFNLGYYLKSNPKYQVAISALLGSMPGCGGSIVVVIQFIKGNASFGALVATLTTTMGDSAFLLISRKPLIALLLIFTQIIVGILLGLFIDKIHGNKFLQKNYTKNSKDADKLESCTISKNEKPKNILIATLSQSLFLLWWVISIPSLGIAVAIVIGFVPLEYQSYANYISIFGIGGSIASVFIWLFSGAESIAEDNSSSSKIKLKEITIKLVKETSFITSWVLIAYIIFAIMVISGLNIEYFLFAWAPLVPLFAILIGFIPGCGPQILVTTMYLNSLIPFSAQLGNALSNDGDAMLPAFSLAPFATALATLYSSIPAFILSYLVYYFEISYLLN